MLDLPLKQQHGKLTTGGSERGFNGLERVRECILPGTRFGEKDSPSSAGPASYNQKKIKA